MLGLHQSVLHATNNAFGFLGWIAARTHSLMPFSFSKASHSEQLQLAQEYLCIDVRLLTGAEVKLRIVSASSDC